MYDVYSEYSLNDPRSGLYTFDEYATFKCRLSYKIFTKFSRFYQVVKKKHFINFLLHFLSPRLVLGRLRPMARAKNCV